MPRFTIPDKVRIQDRRLYIPKLECLRLFGNGKLQKIPDPILILIRLPTNPMP